MKDVIKFIITVTGGAIGALIPIICAYKFWAWSMSMITIASEWAGVIKLAVTIGLLIIGGSVTIACSVLLGLLALGLMIIITDA